MVRPHIASAMLGNDYPPLSVVLSISSYLALPPGGPPAQAVCSTWSAW